MREFEQIKEEIREYQHRILRGRFSYFMRKRKYASALKFAEHHYKTIRLTLNDVKILRFGLNDYQNSLNKLESKVKE